LDHASAHFAERFSKARDGFLVIGRAGLDLYADPPGTKMEDALSFTAALGGSAANIAVALSRQGCKAALMTRVSDDAVGRYTLKQLTHYGVSARHVSAIGGEARNSLAVVETRAENCQSVIYRNDAADFQLNQADVESVDFNSFAAVILTGTALAKEPSRSAAMKAARLAKAAGCTLIIDLDYRPYSWLSKAEAQTVCLKAANLCDIIVGNDEEFAVLAASSSDGKDDGNGLALAMALAKRAGRIVVYKRGAKGCTTFAGGSSFETPVFQVVALKPTGAGDAFMGGFLAGLVAAEALASAVQRGAATAAIVVTRIGCAPAMPDAKDVQAMIGQTLAKAISA
jgi:5-dehydro-2-deoxygluconokinase